LVRRQDLGQTSTVQSPTTKLLHSQCLPYALRIFFVDVANNPEVIESNLGRLQVSALNTRIRTACVLNGHPENMV